MEIVEKDKREFTEQGNLVIETRQETGQRLIQSGVITLRGRKDPIKVSYKRAKQIQVVVDRGARGVVKITPTLAINLVDVALVELIYEPEPIPGWVETEPERTSKGDVAVADRRIMVLPKNVLATDREQTTNPDGTVTVTRTVVARTAVEILKDTKEVFEIREEEPTSVEDGIRKSYANGNASSLWGEALRLNKAVILERNTKKGMWYVVDGKLVLRQARVAEGGGLLWLD